MSEVLPNNVKTTQNFMCTLLMTVLKDLEVLKWFLEDLILEEASPLWLDAASCDFLDVEEVN